MAQPGDVAQPVCVREWNIKRISDVQPMGPMLCQSGRRERTRRNPISHPWQPVLGVNLPQRLNGGPPRSTPPVENHVGVSPLGPDDCIDKIIHTRPGRSSKRWQVTGHGSNDPLLALCEMEDHVGHCPPGAARGTHPHISVVGIKNRFDPILLSGEVIEDIHACGRYNLLAESLTEREPAHTVEARDGRGVPARGRRWCPGPVPWSQWLRASQPRAVSGDLYPPTQAIRSGCHHKTGPV